MKLPIIKYRAIWYVISAVTVGISIAFFSMWGLKQGIEFTGGSLMAVRFEGTRPSAADVQSAIDSAGVDVGTLVLQPVGETDMQVRLKALDEEQHGKVFGAIRQKFSGATELRFDSIGPVIGEELRDKSIKGLALSLGLILVYVAYVFRKVSVPVQSWKYGIVTIVTAFHDVIVPIGVFSYLGHYHNVEIGTPFIAAILTILGYSITDTIVVMDRIRENLQKMSGTFEQIVEASVQQTMLRSLFTSLTTLLTLVAIFLYGGRSLHDFTLALIIGIATGTYSSIFVASPLLVTWQKFAKQR